MNRFRYILGLTAFSTALSIPTASPAQVDPARIQKCNPVKLNWNKANEAGIPGRRKAMKAVLDAAKADPAIGACLSDKIREDLTRAAYDSSAMQGWSGLLKMNTNNFDAARDQAPADRCPASKLVIAGWNSFYTQWRDASAIVNDAAQRRHKAICGG